jgi:PAS domain S-box-containing protein
MAASFGAICLTTQALAALFDEVEEAAVVYDEEFRFVYLNPAAERAMGADAASLLEKVIWDVFPGTAAAYGEPLGRSMRERIPVSFSGEYARTGEKSEGRCVPADLEGFGDDARLGLLVFFKGVTAREEAERARAAEQRALRFLNSVSDAFTYLDSEWRFAFSNAEALRLAGEPAEAFLGVSHWEKYPDLRGTLIESEYRRAVSDQTSVHFDYHFEPGDLWLQINAFPAPKEDGGGLYLVYRDITEQKRAEDKNSLLADLLRQSQDALVVRELDGTIRDLNLAAETLYGYSLSEAVGRKSHELFHNRYPESREAVEDALRRERHWSGEIVQRRRDGADIYVSSRQTLRMGEPPLILASNRDITARKRAEEGLRASERRFRTMADSMPQVAWTAAADGSVLDYNQGWYEFSGLTPEETLAWGWQRVIHPDDVEHATAVWIAAITAGAISEVEYRLRRRDGEYRWHLGRSLPIRDENGRISLWVGTATDIHDRVQNGHERERRLRDATAQARQQEALNQIGDAIRSSLPPDEVQVVALRALGQALGADRCYFATVDAARDQIVILPDFTRGDLPPLAGHYRLSDFAIDIRPIFEGGQNLVLSDTEAPVDPWGPESVAILKAMRMRSLVNVPYRENGEVVAVLGVAMASEPRVWDPDEIVLVETLATEVREAVNAAREQQREHRIAAQLQEALVPSIPESIPGMGLCSYYRAALVEASVGGDFADCFPARGGLLTCLVVADLSGKGLDAASQVASVRNMLRYALHADGTLVAAVTRLNRVLAEQNLLTGFATLFVGMYDSSTRTLAYINCGQEPGLLYRASTGEIEMLSPTGPVLGGFADGEFTESRVIVAPRDVLALFTDGLTESGPTRQRLLEIDGLAAIFGVVAAEVAGEDAPAPERARTVVRNLIERVDAQAGELTAVRDDIALVVAIVQ